MKRGVKLRIVWNALWILFENSAVPGLSQVEMPRSKILVAAKRTDLDKTGYGSQGDPAVTLALDEERVEDAAGVVAGDVTQQRDAADVTETYGRR